MNRVRILEMLVGIVAAASLVACAPEAPPSPQPPEQPAAAAPAPPASIPPVIAPRSPTLPQAAAPAATAAAADTSLTRVGMEAASPVVRRVTRARATSPTAIPAVFPVTVQSGDGRDVVFERPPARIVAFDSAVVEILFAIGEGDRVVGTHQYVSYPPEASEIARVGDAFNMDIEATVALEPDLVFVFFDRFVEDIERTGIKVLYIPTLTQDFEAIADSIRIWGGIVGNPDSAERVAVDFELRIAAIRDTMEPVGAGPLVFQDVGDFWTPGSGTIMQEVFDLLKIENVAADIEGYAQISPEVLVEKDPTVILTDDPTGYLGEPAFEGIRAVRHGALHSLNSEGLSVQGPRFVEGIEELARLVYPGLFR